MIVDTGVIFTDGKVLTVIVVTVDVAEQPLALVTVTLNDPLLVTAIV